MAKHEFKFIKGRCCEGMPADICFYTDVDYWSVDNFLWEFDYLVNYVNPSKIRIHINSVGGSVVDGISVFSKIIDCPLPTECINDGLAASMGSIIWAAGNEIYMKDFALLMIHNPFCEGGSSECNAAIEAFKQQLKTIYVKRFGLSDGEIEDIMNCKEGEDGTFMTATQAVERGFITNDHIIETPSVVKNQILAAIKDTTDIAQIKAIFGLMAPAIDEVTINEQNTNTTKSIAMEKITVIAALFGLTGDKATAENVTSKINELKDKAAQFETTNKALEDTKAQLATAQAELTGAKTSIKNLTDDLEATKASLKKYEEAEAAANEAKVNALIDKAVKDCKINKDERDIYIKMAQDNYELAENVLAKIPARDSLGNIISKANATEAKDQIKTTEQQILDKVEAIVGKDFKFRSLD